MTLRVIEGFDHMSSTTLMASKNWTWDHDNVAASTWTSGFTTGRINGKAFYMHSPADEITTSRLYKILPSIYTSWVNGFAVQFNQMPQLGSSAPLFVYTTFGAVDILRIFVYADGSIRVRNSSTTILASSASGLVTANAWHDIEVKALVNGASGSVAVHLNGVEIIAPTTINVGSTGIQYFGPYSESNNGWSSEQNNDTGVTIYYDDIWLADTAGGDVSDFIGDAHVETLFPNGEGTHSDWTPNAGTVHYNRVNERTGTYPDGDTTYLKALTAGLIDTWQYDDLSITSGTVYGVQTNLYARKDDSNLRQLIPQIVSGGTTYDGSTTQTLASGYVDSTEIFEEDPDTSAPWTVPGVNAAEFGVKVTA